MKTAKYMLHIAGLLVALSLLLGLGSCGTTRAHFGIDHDVAYNWNQGHFEDGAPHKHHKKPKPPKPPKHKEKKHKKHKHHK